MRLFLVDDHPIVLDSLQRTFSAVEGFEVVGTALSWQELRRKLAADGADLLLLDVDLPDGSGIEILRWIRAEHPALAVVLFSVHQEVELIRLAHRLGARGFVRKTTPVEQLIGALRAVGGGGLAFEQRILDLDTSARSPGAQEGPLHGSLSSREMQVLLLVAQGLSQKEVCYRLGLSQSAVATYVARIRSKLGLGSLADVVEYCVKHGLKG